VFRQTVDQFQRDIHCLLCAGFFYSQTAQEALYAGGGNGKIRTSGVLTPRKAVTKKVDGGYLIEEGIWGFNSGVYHAQWDLLGIPLVDENGQMFDQGMALLPISDVELLHDWDTMALRGSGSTSVRVTGKFVPDSRITPFSKILTHDYVAHLVVARCVEEIEAHAAQNVMPEPMLRGRIRRDTGFASKMLWDAMDMLASASGGSLAGSRNPMNRIWRDARVANLHSVVCTTTNLELYGRMLCGLEPNTILV